MKISIVIPAHNEEEVIAGTLRGIEENVTCDYEVIVVNDHSTDATCRVVEDFSGKYSGVKLVNNDGQRGFAGALKKGFSVAAAEFVIPVMADLCDDPGTINEMCLKAAEGYDIVCGSRYMRGGSKLGGPPIQSFFSRLVGISLRRIIGIPTSDVSNSFKLYRKEVLEAFDISSSGFEISMEIPLKAFFCGYAIAELPTFWKGREMGKSKFYIFKVAPNYIRLYIWALFSRKVKRCKK